MMMTAEAVSTLPLPEAAVNGVLSFQRELSDFDSVTGFLDAGRSGLHAYELRSQAGNQVRLRVTSDAFHAVAFVIGATPGGQPFRKVVPGVPSSAAGGVEAQPPVTLPSDGVYRVVVTSVENQAQRRAVSSGEYRMTLVVDAPSVEPPVDSERGTRFSAWESDLR
jgi:hypothetical protein